MNSSFRFHFLYWPINKRKKIDIWKEIKTENLCSANLEKEKCNRIKIIDADLFPGSGVTIFFLIPFYFQGSIRAQTISICDNSIFFSRHNTCLDNQHLWSPLDCISFWHSTFVILAFCSEIRHHLFLTCQTKPFLADIFMEPKRFMVMFNKLVLQIISTRKLFRCFVILSQACDLAPN